MADSNKNEEYERLLEQAVSKIAVYSDEWTNHLPSDPGITILENLTAFQLLLLEKIRAVPEDIRCVLPGLLGVRPYPAACAKVLLGAYDSGGMRAFDKHEKFYLGELCFETAEEVQLPWGRMRSVYREHCGQIKEIEELKAGNPLSAPIFGSTPQTGDAVYLLFNGPYAEAGGEVQLYVDAQPSFKRNPPDAAYPVRYASARWSYYTEEGYKDAQCLDETGVFLKSGVLRIRLGDLPPALGNIMGESGYLLKCVLLHEEYDQIPRVKQIEGPLFEVYEMDSKAVSYELPYKDSYEFLHRMKRLCSLDNDRYLFVYVGNNREGYKECQESEAEILNAERGAQKYGSEYREEPADIWQQCQSVKLIYMEKEMVVQKLLGTLYGYDNQEFEVSIPGEAVPDSFEIMVEKCLGEETRSFFFSPLQNGAGDVRFEYDSKQRALRILDAGDFEGDKISISNYAIFHGAEGNVLPENQFFRLNGSGEEIYRNPVGGQGGRALESLDETVARMQHELHFPGALVTAADYEQMAGQVPDLCIHKVHACRGEGNREIQIFVKPYGEEAMPGLSKLYIRQIQKYLEGRRLLGTKIGIAGPKYIAVDVSAVIIVKVQYADARQEIEKTIRRELDYINQEYDFGSTVSRHRLLQALERLPCIEYIENLTLSAQENRESLIKRKPASAELNSMDIRLPADGLCYAGKLELILKRSSMI